MSNVLMRATFLIGVAMVAGTLVGCAETARPMKIAKDTYRISQRVPFNGPSGAKGQGLQEANAFCTKLGREMLLYHEHSYECALHDGCGEAVIYFLCLAEDDPLYKAQYQQRLDEGVSIIEYR